MEHRFRSHGAPKSSGGVTLVSSLARHAYRYLCGGVYLTPADRVRRCGESREGQRRPKPDRRHGNNQRPPPRSPPAVNSSDDHALVWRLWWRSGGGRSGSRDDRPPSSSDAAALEAGGSGAQGRHVLGRTGRYSSMYGRHLRRSDTVASVCSCLFWFVPSWVVDGCSSS